MITSSTGGVNVIEGQEHQVWTFIEEDIDEEVLLIPSFMMSLVIIIIG